jgi:calcineurin-like phosphoesterase family protein
MNNELIERHNSVVPKDGITVHIGDFSFGTKQETSSIIKQLNGTHIFLEGDHDRWLNSARQIWKRKIDRVFIVCCHWSMFSWPKAHYGAWCLYGHHHGRLQGPGKSMDVGVDTNNFFPYTFEQVREKMKQRPENPGLVKKNFGYN